MSNQSVVQAYMEQVKAEMIANQPLPDEFTVKMFMEELGLPTTYRKSAGFLMSEVAKGKLTVRKVVVDGNETNYYKPVK